MRKLCLTKDLIHQHKLIPIQATRRNVPPAPESGQVLICVYDQWGKGLQNTLLIICETAYDVNERFDYRDWGYADISWCLAPTPTIICNPNNPNNFIISLSSLEQLKAEDLPTYNVVIARIYPSPTTHKPQML